MKYVQSFWSKPLSDALKGDDHPINYFAGFPNRFSFLCVWTYSCLSIKEFYPNLHFVTDDAGIDLFEEKLQLPYTSFSRELNQLEELPSYLWAFGKLKAYGLQEEPFCHIDGDVCLFGPVLDKITNAPLFFQSFDHYFDIYSKVHQDVHENYQKVPTDFQSELSSNMKYINAGVLGGNDINSIKSYVDQAFELIHRNKHLINAKKSWELNLYCEQFLISNMIERHNIDCKFLFSDPDEGDRYNFADFEGIPNRSQYIHLYFNKKRKTDYIEQIVARLQLEYPNYYQRILNLDTL